MFTLSIYSRDLLKSGTNNINPNVFFERLSFFLLPILLNQNYKCEYRASARQLPVFSLRFCIDVGTLSKHERDIDIRHIESFLLSSYTERMLVTLAKMRYVHASRRPNTNSYGNISIAWIAMHFFEPGGFRSNLSLKTVSHATNDICCSACIEQVSIRRSFCRLTPLIQIRPFPMPEFTVYRRIDSFPMKT